MESWTNPLTLLRHTHNRGGVLGGAREWQKVTPPLYFGQIQTAKMLWQIVGRCINTRDIITCFMHSNRECSLTVTKEDCLDDCEGMVEARCNPVHTSSVHFPTILLASA